MLAVTRTLIFVLLIPCSMHAQEVSIQLSPSHMEKLNKTSNATRKLLLYEKYFRADSAIQMKKILEAAEEETDSLLQSAANGTIIDSTWALHRIAQRLNFIQADSSLSDSAKEVAIGQLRKLASEKLRLDPSLEKSFDEYISGADSLTWQTLLEKVPALDSLQSLFNADPALLFGTMESKLSELLVRKGVIPFGSGVDAAGIRNSTAAALPLVPALPNVASLKAQMANKAQDTFVDLIDNNVSSLSQAREKVSKLLTKYRSFSNSEDLKDAVTQTSLAGKTFRERLIFGSDFQVITFVPFAVDVSLKGGYRFNSRALVGGAINYRFTSNDTIPSLGDVSKENSSFRFFVSYDLVRSFFATTEWERSHRSSVALEPGRKRIISQDNFFAGAGKRLLIHPKLNLTITALYNLSRENDTSFYRQRFQLRTGFQLSELATRRKATYYNPNH